MKVKKHIIQNFISRVCFMGTTLLVNVLFARLLGASGSGALFYSMNNYALITLLASFSLESGMTYFLSRKEIAPDELVTFSAVWTICAACLAGGLQLYLQQQELVSNSYYHFFYSFTFITGTLLTTYFSSLFYARQHFLYQQLVPAVMNAALLCYGLFFLLTHTNADPAVLIRLYFISFMAGGLVLGWLYQVRYPGSFSFHWPGAQALRRLFKYSSVAFIANIVSFLAYRIDYWILRKFMPHIITENALGNYIQVAKLVQLFLFAPTIVATIVFPVSAKGTGGLFYKTFNRMIWWVLLLNITGCILLLITGKPLFTFMFGNSFSAMYSCFVFSVPAILAITVVRVLASYFAGTNLVRYNLAGGIIALVIIAALNFILIPVMGINGAAVADSCGYTAYMIFLLISFRGINKSRT